MCVCVCVSVLDQLMPNKRANVESLFLSFFLAKVQAQALEVHPGVNEWAVSACLWAM